ncbi:MAG: tripartite tricarboxylate transporter TctB family protein [Betaproteobacteria bacterium]
MNDSESSGPSVGTRWPELVVAALLVLVALLVIKDSLRVGIGWADDGPRSGYFPFYIGLLLLASSGSVLLRQLWRWREADAAFAGRGQIALVVSMLVPMLVYLGLIFGLGIYVASALLIGFFMFRHGKYGATLTLPVALGVPLVFFLVFERWFLVSLPKGPLERLLGF